MFSSLQKLTVIFLVIVQFIAPLVHAHAGKNIGLSANTGTGSLHVPGLERYGVDRLLPAETMHCSVATHDFHSDGILVGINLGIKDSQTNVDLNSGQFLSQQALAFNAPIFSVNASFPSQSQRVVSRLLLSSLRPRAPPIQ